MKRISWLFCFALVLFAFTAVFAIEPMKESSHFYFPISIDYHHPEIFLKSGKQSALADNYLQELTTEIPRGTKNLENVSRIYRWIRSHFKSVAAGGTNVGKGTVNELFQTKLTTGCHDDGLVLSSVLRSFGYPAIMVDAAGIEWAYEYNGGGSNGHVFVEAFINNQWILMDSNSGEYIEAYDPYQPVIPITKKVENKGYYVLYKGIDPADYGVTNLNTLQSQMRKFATALQSNKIICQFPNYHIQNFLRKN